MKLSSLHPSSGSRQPIAASLVLSLLVVLVAQPLLAQEPAIQGAFMQKNTYALFAIIRGVLLIAGMLFTGYRALESLFSEDAGKWKQVGFGLLAVLILYNPNWPLKWLFGMGNVIPDTYIGLPFAGLS